LDYRIVVAGRASRSAETLRHPVVVEFNVEKAVSRADGENVPCAITEGAPTVVAPTVYSVVPGAAILRPVGRCQVDVVHLYVRGH